RLPPEKTRVLVRVVPVARTGRDHQLRYAVALQEGPYRVLGRRAEGTDGREDREAEQRVGLRRRTRVCDGAAEARRAVAVVLDYVLDLASEDAAVTVHVFEDGVGRNGHLVVAGCWDAG